MLLRDRRLRGHLVMFYRGKEALTEVVQKVVSDEVEAGRLVPHDGVRRVHGFSFFASPPSRP